jgi:hypothetical protein
MTIKIAVPGGSIERTVVRAFDVSLNDQGKESAGQLLLCGQDEHDHDLWFADQDKLALVGVLSLDAMKKVRRTRRLSIDVSAEDSTFDFITKDFKKAIFCGSVSIFQPKARYSGSY